MDELSAYTWTNFPCTTLSPEYENSLQEHMTYAPDADNLEDKDQAGRYHCLHNTRNESQVKCKLSNYILELNSHQNDHGIVTYRNITALHYHEKYLVTEAYVIICAFRVFQVTVVYTYMLFAHRGKNVLGLRPQTEGRTQDRGFFPIWTSRPA